MVRVRKLDVSANSPFKHILTVDAMANGKDSDLYSLRTFFDEAGVMYGKYNLFHVVLSFHFHPKKAGGRGQVIHLSLKKNGSDLKHLKEDDRQMIEGYLKQWGILENIAVEQPETEAEKEYA